LKAGQLKSVSKPLFLWLRDDPAIEQFIVDEDGGWRDPTQAGAVNDSGTAHWQTAISQAIRTAVFRFQLNGPLPKTHPDAVIRFGPMPVSKPLFLWLRDDPAIEQFIVDEVDKLPFLKPSGRPFSGFSWTDRFQKHRRMTMNHMRVSFSTLSLKAVRFLSETACRFATWIRSLKNKIVPKDKSSMLAACKWLRNRSLTNCHFSSHPDGRFPVSGHPSVFLEAVRSAETGKRPSGWLEKWQFVNERFRSLGGISPSSVFIDDKLLNGRIISEP
jgi:hypothetical protein